MNIHIEGKDDKELIDSEKEHIQAEPKCGLALSGGGIRSAAFSLGVIQALDKAEIFKNFDYLSTVSGGGYMGSSLSWWLHQHNLKSNQNNPNDKFFPFRIGTERGNNILRFFRTHANYLLPGFGLNLISLGAVILRQTIVTLLVYLSIFVFAVVCVAKVLNGIPEFLDWICTSSDWVQSIVVYLTISFSKNWYFVPSANVMIGSALILFLGILFRIVCNKVKSLFPIILVLPFIFVPIEEFIHWYERILIGNFNFSSGFELNLAKQFLFATTYFWSLFVVGSIVYSLLTVVYQMLDNQFTMNRLRRFRYRQRTEAQIGFGKFLAVSIVLLFVSVLPVLHGGINIYSDSKYQVLALVTALALITLGLVIASTKSIRKRVKINYSILRRNMPVIGVILLLFGFFLWVLILAKYFGDLKQYKLWIMAITAIVVGLFVNINFLGMHRMYRDRLMELFLPEQKSVEKNTWNYSDEADSRMIHEIGKSKYCRPYHLINTNIVLVDSRTQKFRSRGGDNFIFSPLYCGSSATGWCKSESYLKSNDPGFTLATAMAISGAAANPNTGGEGSTGNRLVSIAMTILGIRLGYWAPNPNPKKSIPILPPNFIYPGVTSGLIFGNLDEDGRTVDLTDGGHFENLGLYELIRRKLEYIVVCDGSSDPEYKFTGLATAISRVKTDFNVEIKFKDAQYDLQGLIPSTSQKNSFDQQLANRGFAMAEIFYGDDSESKGKLVYIKATLVKNLPSEVYLYKKRNPIFPHQSSTDQFFDEEQFEAYRELGYELGLNLDYKIGLSEEMRHLRSQ